MAPVYRAEAMEFSDTSRQRAEEILTKALPIIRGHDHALDNLYFVELNDSTTLPSIAAALHVLGLWPRWNPIDTAPIRRTPVLVWARDLIDQDSFLIGMAERRADGAWHWYARDSNPPLAPRHEATHWMPLLDPPQ